MVYIDPEELKWMPYVQTWLTGLAEKVKPLKLFQDIFFTVTELLERDLINSFVGKH